MLALGDPRLRLRATILLVGFVLSLFAGRLLQLQGLEASSYALSAEKQRTRTITLPATRGSILDAAGVALATSVDARNVTADQTLVQDPAATARALAPLLGADPATLQQRLTGKRRFVYLAKSVTPQTWRTITGLKLPGIFSERASRRVYPAGPLAANIVGFVGADGHGLGGLERSLEGILAGRDGQARYEIGAGGRQIPFGDNAQHDPTDGRDVQLTINRDIQWLAEDALARKVKETKSASGYAIVLDARTGDIYAMATTPGFDPARPGAARPERLGNPAVTDNYEPGSTGKVLTAAALLEEGAVTPDTPLTVPPRLHRAGTSFKDFNRHGQLRLTFAGAVAKSSNMGMILAAERLPGGLTDLYPWFVRFGLGQPSGAGLPGESVGAVPSPADWSVTTGYTMAFGQGYSVNALQMASVFATVANDGVRVTPRIVAGWRDRDGRFQPAPPTTSRRVVSAGTAATLRTILEAVILPGGTAPKAGVPGYRTAGKTGTANRYNDAVKRYAGYTMSFIGFAPADAPRLVVAVTLQEPKSGSGGGSTAGPVFRELLGFALEKLRIPPTGTRPPVVRLEAR